MAKAYWISHVDVRQQEAYKLYIPVSTAAIAAHGGRFIVRGGNAMQTEGALRGRHVVVEFPSFDAAVACYESPEYQQARAIRAPHSQADIVIVEGLD